MVREVSVEKTQFGIIIGGGRRCGHRCGHRCGQRCRSRCSRRCGW